MKATFEIVGVILVALAIAAAVVWVVMLLLGGLAHFTGWPVAINYAATFHVVALVGVVGGIFRLGQQ